jgi:signal transduction histidine kinase
MKVTRRRLVRRLLTLFLLPTVLCMGGYGYLSVEQRRGELLREAERELTDEVAALRATLPVIAVGRDRDAVVALLQGIASRQRVHGIALYDAECRLIARSHDLDPVATRVDELACQTGDTWQGVIRFGGTATLMRVEAVEGAPQLGRIAVTYHLDAVEEMIRHGALQLAVAGLLLVLALGLLALFIAHWLARPIASLVDAAERVAQGDLSARVEPAAHLDLKRVTDAFNHMTASLAEAQAQVDKSEALRRAFEERMRHAQALGIVGQVAAALAHDIGSPLNTILAWARVVGNDAALPAGTREEAQLVVAQCERITRILRRMLSVARPPVPERGPVELVAVIREVTSFLAPECRRHGVQIELDLPEGPVELIAERDGMLQVVLNLCMNAIQAQPGGGRLVVALRADEGMLELEVRDAGPGLPRELRDRVLDLFYSTRQEAGGTGLGLPIVAQVVGDLDGQLQIDDAPEGGACFRLRLPRRPAEPAHLAAQPGYRQSSASTQPS